MNLSRIMKSTLILKALVLAFAIALLPSTRSYAAENVVDEIELVRSIYKADRQTFLAESMRLTESESAAFWPLYRAYRADMDKLGDGLVKLVLEYADAYPNVSDERARRLLKEYTALEAKILKKRTWYLNRAGKTLPAAKVLRWAQLEHRMDLGLRLQLAGAVPLVPTSKP